MFPLMIPMLIGAAGGALMNRKDPLKGALLGTAMGGAGGLLGGAGGAVNGAKGLFGAIPDMAMGVKPVEALATNAANVTSVLGAPATPGFFGSQTGAGMANAASSLPAPSFMDKATGLLGQVEKYTKPIGTAMNAASAMREPQQPMPQAPPMPPASGPAGLSQLAAQQNQVAMGQRQYDIENRKRRQALLNRMMG